MIKKEIISVSDEEPTFISDDDATVAQTRTNTVGATPPITKYYTSGRNTRFYLEGNDKIRRNTIRDVSSDTIPQELVVKGGSVKIPLNAHTLIISVRDLAILFDCSMSNVSNAWRRYTVKRFGEFRRWPGTFGNRIDKPIYAEDELPNTYTELREWLKRYANNPPSASERWNETFSQSCRAALKNFVTAHGKGL
jgi:DNA-binding transcriptional regulator YhcF (GntR family)